MIREICDVCRKNDAEEKYCFQKSTRIKYQNTSRGIGPVSYTHLIPCGQVPCDYCKLYGHYDWSSSPSIRNKCKGAFVRWANSEYKEPEIDWTKVPVDTPVLVWDFEKDKDEAERVYFSRYVEVADYPYEVFDDGRTSWSSGDYEVSTWRCCELAREEDVEKYRKR